MIGMGVTTNLWVFAVCLIVANGISCALGYQLAPVMIARWFPKRKGIIMGIVTMGIPLCSGIATMMYQTGYKAMGSLGGFLPFIIVFAVALIILVCFLADTPAEKGFVPDNGTLVEGEEEKGINKESIWTTKKLLSYSSGMDSWNYIGISAFIRQWLNGTVIPSIAGNWIC